MADIYSQYASYGFGDRDVVLGAASTRDDRAADRGRVTGRGLFVDHRRANRVTGGAVQRIARHAATFGREVEDARTGAVPAVSAFSNYGEDPYDVDGAGPYGGEPWHFGDFADSSTLYDPSAVKVSPFGEAEARLGEIEGRSEGADEKRRDGRVEHAVSRMDALQQQIYASPAPRPATQPRPQPRPRPRPAPVAAPPPQRVGAVSPSTPQTVAHMTARGPADIRPQQRGYFFVRSGGQVVAIPAGATNAQRDTVLALIASMGATAAGYVRMGTSAEGEVLVPAALGGSARRALAAAVL